MTEIERERGIEKDGRTKEIEKKRNMIDGKNREKKADNRRRESFCIRSRTSVVLKKKRQTSRRHTSLCPEARRGLIGSFVCPSDAQKRHHKHILLIRLDDLFYNVPKKAVT